MQHITKLASPNCVFLGVLPVSIFIRALFNCLIVILNLFIFNLPLACRNANLALEDRLTKDSFSERLTSHIAACKFFSPGCEIFRLQLCQFQPDPGRWHSKLCGKTGDCRVGPVRAGVHPRALRFPSTSSTLCSGSSLPPAWIISQLEACCRYSSGKTRAWGCRDGLVAWVCLIGKNCEKGSSRNMIISGAEFRSHEISVSGHGNTLPRQPWGGHVHAVRVPAVPRFPVQFWGRFKWRPSQSLWRKSKTANWDEKISRLLHPIQATEP